MNNENYTVDCAIGFFEAIPENQWLIRDFGDNSGRGCAYGLWFQSGLIIGELTKLFGGGSITVATRINNGDDPRYQQRTPKARILQALRDIKAKQEAEQPKTPPVREPVGCVHMWLETTQTCLYCCASKPVEQRVTAQL